MVGFRGSLILPDLPVAGTYDQRRHTLNFACAAAKIPGHTRLHEPIPDNAVLLIADYRWDEKEDSPTRLWDLLKECNRSLGCQFYEGIVAKRADSLYPVQLRSHDSDFPFWVKHRWAWWLLNRQIICANGG